MKIPIYNIPKARIFSLFLTEKCDKICYYCDIPYNENKLSTNKKLLFKYLPILEKEGNFERYTLTGGEPGLVDDEIFEFIFKTINTKKHPIKINTNGKFFTTGLYDKYKEHINEVGYHPIINPSDEIPIKYIDKKTILYIPFHRKNMHEIKPLLLKYPNILFNPIPYICKKSFGNKDYILDYKHIIEVYKTIKDLPNLTYGTFTSILTKINPKNYDTFRLSCQNSNTRYSFNFVTGFIGRCPESVSLNDKVEMTDDNINKVIKLNLFSKNSTIIDKACFNCYYFDSFIPYFLKNKLLENK